MERVARWLLQVEIERIVAEAAARGSPLTPLPLAVCLFAAYPGANHSVHHIAERLAAASAKSPRTPNLVRPRKSPKVRRAVSQIDCAALHAENTVTNR